MIGRKEATNLDVTALKRLPLTLSGCRETQESTRLMSPQGLGVNQEEKISQMSIRFVGDQLSLKGLGREGLAGRKKCYNPQIKRNC